MKERLQYLIGETQLHKLEQSTVAIFGLGGVGSFACEALARSFIGTIILIDSDHFESSNINRQLGALHSTINKNKVEVMKERILDINPNCNVITYPIFYNFETKQQILKHKIDYICDCIDTITFKIDLIKHAIDHNINIISVMGTANKVDPTKLEIDYIQNTSYDPIAKVIRAKLKKEQYYRKIDVVYSKEIPSNKKDKSILGSNCFVPSSAGILAANYIFRKITEEI